MGLKEAGSQTAGEFLSRASRVALDTSVNEAFFESMGTVASEAILREDTGALDIIYGGLEMKMRNPFLQDTGTRNRLLGSRVIIAGGRMMIRRLQGNNGEWTTRETNRAALTLAIDNVLTGTQEHLIPTIGYVVPDAIQSFDREYLQFGHDQLARLTAPELPRDLRMLVTGMLDIVRPALTRIKGPRG